MSKGSEEITPEDNEEVTYDSEGIESEFGNSLSGSPEKKIKKLQSDLKKCQEEKQEYLDGWQRIKADFVNLKKRGEEDKKDFVKYATEEFIMELLPALDSFDQAFANKENWEKVDQNWRTGVEFIYSQIQQVLIAHNVTEIESLGEEFDPKLHHSVDTVEVENEKDDGKIVDVIQKGYQLGDKVIRHPNVKVGEFKS